MHKPPCTFLLVSGFHRSGTSLVAKTLARNGVDMGQDLMGASFANTEGHYEDVPLVSIHDYMLYANGTNWQEHRQINFDTPQFLNNRLTRYLDKRIEQADSQGVLLGAKDPRALMFHSQWKKQQNVVLKSLFVFRDWHYSVSSLLKRHSRELLQTSSAMNTRPLDLSFWQDPLLATKMWIASAKAMIAWYQADTQNTLIFPLSAVINGDKKLSQALEEMNLPGYLLDAKSTVKKELLHSSIPVSLLSLIPLDVQKECNKLTEALHNILGVQPEEEVSFTESSTFFPVKLSSDAKYKQIKPGQKTVERATPKPFNPVIDLSKFNFDDAIRIVNECPASTNKLHWDKLLTQTGATPKNYDDIFAGALKSNELIIAELAIRRALDIQPASWRWMQLGDLHKRRGELDKAETCYGNAIERTPENATFYARLAEVEIARGNLEKGQERIDQAKALDSLKPAIANAEAKLSKARDKIVFAEQDTARFSTDNYAAMKVVKDYTEVVDVMTHQPESGKELDAYLVKSAFVLRSNYQWLAEGLSELPINSRQNLLDYLFSHTQRYWPEAIINTEFAEEATSVQHENKCLISPRDSSLPTGRLKLGIHIHVFYIALLPEIYTFLSNLSYRINVVITCPHEIVAKLNDMFSKHPYTKVIGVENRGRDVAPWLMVAAKALRQCDLVLKVHTKRTPHASKLAGWRLQLLWFLLGETGGIEKTLTQFKENDSLGVRMPAYHPHILKDINWGENRDELQRLSSDFNIPVDLDESVLPFPAGSMFWYRPSSLAPLTDFTWKLEHFPEELGQTDGTIMHAIERFIPYVCAHTQHKTSFILKP